MFQLPHDLRIRHLRSIQKSSFWKKIVFKLTKRAVIKSRGIKIKKKIKDIINRKLKKAINENCY